MQMIQTTNHVTKALNQKQFFKLVCGASLTDTRMIEDLSFIFTLAGAHVIDLAPTADVIFAARKGVQKAISYEPSAMSPLLMASIQLDKDPHFRKVEVDYNLCDLCGACVKVCPTEAFKIESHRFNYFSERCFGCDICPSYCHVDALKMIDTKPSPEETLSEMISLGVRSIEFHFGNNFYKIQEIWGDVKDLVKKLELVSFSIGSELLSDKDIRKAANLCYNLAGGGIILQCDGAPMSGSLTRLTKSGNNTDNSCLHVASIIEEEKLPVYLQISGGTNENSFIKATNAGLNIHGIAIGSYARKLLMPYLTGKENIEDALKIARLLVGSVGAGLLL